MPRFFLLGVALAVLTLCPLAAQTPIFNQPYDAYGYGYFSVYDPLQSTDYEVADNFYALPGSFNSFTFYGATGFFISNFGPQPPAPLEPFSVKIYGYEAGWTQPPEPEPGLLLTATGTYVVELYDDYGDGWTGGSLDVYVDGTLVCDHITLASGAGPETYLFDASAGDELIIVYNEGNWSYENWYQVRDPDLNVIFTDGAGGSVPEGIGLLPYQPLLAATTGTYTVDLYDSYGDGWEDGRLDVYVNNVLILDDIYLDSGAGPGSVTFPAAAGDEIATLYYAGNWPTQNWYQILDPDLNVIAQDGNNTGYVVPQGIGFVSEWVVEEPAWSDPLYSWTLDAASSYVGPWGTWSLYRFEVQLPLDVDLTEGWISAQIDAQAGSGVWFAWVESLTGDELSHQREGGGKGGANLARIPADGAPKQDLFTDMGFELWYEEPNVPVELSSFTALVTAVNLIQIAWTTQSETGVQGYFIYRNTAADLAGALLASPLIQAANSPAEHRYTFTDSEINAAGTYWYWLQNVDFNGNTDFHGPVSLIYNPGQDINAPQVPLLTELLPLYPNPFNPSLAIPFTLAESGRVELRIFNSRGQLLRHFDLHDKAPGSYRLLWDGKDAGGLDCGSGIYHIQLQAGSQLFNRKAVLLK